MGGIFTGFDLEITTGDHSLLGPTWGFRNCAQSCARLYLVDGGEGFLTDRNGVTTKLRPGHLYLIPPRSGFSAGCRKRVEITWIHFNIRMFSSVSFFDLADCRLETKADKDGSDKASMRRILSEFQRRDLKARLRVTGELLRILSGFARKKDAAGLEKEEAALRFASVLEHIDRNCGEKLRVSGLAKIASLERAYFSTLFTKAFGVAPKEYVIRKKIEKAGAALLRGDAKIDSIGRDFGFRDGFHFARTFKRVTGLSPSEHRSRKGISEP